MSETPAKPPAAEPAKKSSSSPLGLILPAILAGAAAFGGARVAGAHGQGAPPAEHAEPAAKPPGPTLTLDPFLVTVQDAAKKSHPMKVTLAVEFDASTKEDAIKNFVPRIRDISLTYLRGLSYEIAIDPKPDQIRADLLDRARTAGAATAQQVLITDLVVQ